MLGVWMVSWPGCGVGVCHPKWLPFLSAAYSRWRIGLSHPKTRLVLRRAAPYREGQAVPSSLPQFPPKNEPEGAQAMALFWAGLAVWVLSP